MGVICELNIVACVADDTVRTSESVEGGFLSGRILRAF